MSQNSERENMYLEEAEELLAEVESKLVELESVPDDFDLLNTLFRNLHTLKGSGSMFGYEEVANFTHDIETLFDLLRDQKLEVTKEIIDLTLEAKDHIWKMLFSPEEATTLSEERKHIQDAFKNMAGNDSAPRDSLSKSKESAAGSISSESGEHDQENDLTRTFRIIFAPEGSIFARGTKVLPLIEELAGLGTCIAMAHTDSVPVLEELDPEQCYVKWTFLLTTAEEENAVRDVFIFVEDDAEVRVEIIDEEQRLDVEEDYKAIGKILCERGTLQAEDIDEIIKHHERFGEIAVHKGIVSDSEVDSALEEQEYIRRRRQNRRKSSSGSSIRVKSEKLDTLINLVSELVTLQAGLEQYSKDHSKGNGNGQSNLDSISEQLERITSGLRDNTMNLRMVPLADTFTSFTRLVRDLCHELGKNAVLEVYGSAIELDKHIIDKLKDPLVHIIRNSLDHGIEEHEERVKKGKPPQATVTVGAEYKGADVIIRITDDGRGIDAEQVRRTAQQRGLIAGDEDMNEKESLALIFQPGFSTAEEATSVSGRGVGMDVVKKNIESLRGAVEMESEIDRGTTITLTIPLTLSIIDGLLFTVGGEYYIINLSAVEECFDLSEEVRCDSETRQYVKVRETPISCIDLARLFETETSEEKRQGIVIKGEKEKVALLVDTILGQHQTVIKPLHSTLKEVQELSGSTILGDGSIAFILDVHKVLEGMEATTPL